MIDVKCLSDRVPTDQKVSAFLVLGLIQSADFRVGVEAFGIAFPCAPIGSVRLELCGILFPIALENNLHFVWIRDTPQRAPFLAVLCVLLGVPFLTLSNLFLVIGAVGACSLLYALGVCGVMVCSLSSGCGKLAPGLMAYNARPDRGISFGEMSVFAWLAGVIAIRPLSDRLFPCDNRTLGCFSVVSHLGRFRLLGWSEGMDRLQRSVPSPYIPREQYVEQCR